LTPAPSTCPAISTSSVCTSGTSARHARCFRFRGERGGRVAPPGPESRHAATASTDGLGTTDPSRTEVRSMLIARNRNLLSDPVFARMDGFWRDFDRLVSNVFATDWTDTGAWIPPAEIEETGEHIRYVFEVPGIRPEELDVTVERN